MIVYGTDTLTDRERLVLQLRYGSLDGDARTIKEVAAVLRISPQRVAQIEAKALRKLRTATEAHA